MYTAELNAACPNSVIEAMACGLPIVGFDTGSIHELLGEEGGICVSYGNNHWLLEPPDIPALTQAGLTLLNKRTRFRESSRQRAISFFNLDLMVEKYLDALIN
jgi:glycosyltransferase involved in cell wall biosynthesis